MKLTYHRDNLQSVAEEFLKIILEQNAHIVGLSGNLGAGKTTLMQNVAKLLGVGNNVVSPTFVLRRDYSLIPSASLTPTLSKGEGVSLISGPSPKEKGGVRFFQTSLKENYDSLKMFAKGMRREQTEAENFLWQNIRGNKLGHKFRRQHVVNNFIVDFVNLQNKLIIEVDGEIHDKQKDRDLERTKILENSGFRILRFKNEEILNNIDSVLKKIQEALTPLSFGEGLGVRPTTLIHIDAYRLEKPSMISQVLTKEEMDNKENLIVIEWAELVDKDIFDLIFQLEHVGDEERKIEMVYSRL